MATDTESLEETLTRLLPPYRVLLHNDDHNAMDYVVFALLETVTTLSSTRATEIMIEAHLRGVALVVTCPKEQAEHYRDRLRGYGLVATIEPDR